MTDLFLALLDGGLARCAGEAGPVGMSWCSLSSAVRWTPGHPILIRFAAAAICPSSMINPGCYLAPAGRTVNTVCVCVCVCLHECVYFTRRSSREFPSNDLLRHQKCNWQKYSRHFADVFHFRKDA